MEKKDEVGTEAEGGEESKKDSSTAQLDAFGGENAEDKASGCSDRNDKLGLGAGLASDEASNCWRVIGVNFTWSPSDRRLKPSRSAWNIAIGVRPSSLQPPGVSNG